MARRVGRFMLPSAGHSRLTCVKLPSNVPPAGLANGASNLRPTRAPQQPRRAGTEGDATLHA